VIVDDVDVVFLGGYSFIIEKEKEKRQIYIYIYNRIIMKSTL